MKNIYKFIGVLVIAALSSCSSDYLDTVDTSVLDAETAGRVAAKNPDAFLNGMWTWNVSYNISGNSSHDDFALMATLLCFDVMSEDIAFGASHWFIYDYDFDYRLEQYSRPYAHWSLFYTDIAKANEIISLFPNGAKEKAEKSLLGQAYAMRGFSYYYLIQIYTDYMQKNADEINFEAPGVPLYLTTAEGYDLDQLENLKGRNTVKEVFAQIENDLVNGVNLLTESEYTRSTSDPNGKDYIDASVANGMLARYYLLSRQWDKAAATAKLAYSNYKQRGQAELLDGFMDVTQCDVMWGFNHTTETQTTYASYFSHISNIAPGYGGIGYCPKLIDARLYSQIDENDYRKALFNGPKGNPTHSSVGARGAYANLKFGDDGNWTMDYIYMRAAEMVLIEAEALAHQDKGSEAAASLKKLMENRVPGWNKSSVTVADVLLQRRIELWGEGFSYFDLKRNNLGMSRKYEGSNHLAGHLLEFEPHDVAWTYQIPRREIQENIHISQEDQNP